jgi:GT2 family glycosyltransferase
MLSGVSIIICTKNRPADLLVTLDSVFSQRVLPDTLVIVDDGPAEATRGVLEKFTGVKTVRILHVCPDVPSAGLPAARNRGIRELPDSRGIVLFLDDDVTLEESYIGIIRDLFRNHPGLCGAAGFMQNAYHARSLPARVLLLACGLLLPNLVPVSLHRPRITRTGEALYPLFRRPGSTAVPAQWLSGCNMAYRASVFEEGFRFDEQLVRYAQGEDMLFSHRLYQEGGMLLLSYNAHLVHRISPESRIPPFPRLVMMFGYRNYAISRFTAKRVAAGFWYRIFVLQYFLSSLVIALRSGTGIAAIREVARAYGMTRGYEEEIRAGAAGRFNRFLESLW